MQLPAARDLGRPRLAPYLHVMRAFLACLLLATPGHAWDFSNAPICMLTHIEAEAGLQITYDPSRAEPFEIELVRREKSWPEGGVFGIEFEGGRSSTIVTDRHRLSDGGTRLKVSDQGFGNLLDGLVFNTTATARLADTSVAFSLAGAAAPVAAFRACTEAPFA
ncbi:MAG: excinuclease ABC subunit B [Pseudomonadota bacterium]